MEFDYDQIFAEDVIYNQSQNNMLTKDRQLRSFMSRTSK